MDIEIHGPEAVPLTHLKTKENLSDLKQFWGRLRLIPFIFPHL